MLLRRHFLAADFFDDEVAILIDGDGDGLALHGDMPAGIGCGRLESGLEAQTAQGLEAVVDAVTDLLMGPLEARA